MKKVTVVPTVGNFFEVETSATTWGELKQEIYSRIPNINELEAVEDLRETSLVSDTSVLPDEDFNLFLTPKKMKSGLGYTPSEVNAMSYAELKKIASNSQDVKDYLLEHYERNWTNASTSQMKEAIEAYCDYEEEMEEEVEESFVETTDVKNVQPLQEIKEDLQNILSKVEKFLSKKALSEKHDSKKEELLRKQKEIFQKMGIR